MHWSRAGAAVDYATFVVALFFFPILTMTGLEGRLFAPLAVALILAIVASLVVALTVTPALCLVMLSRTGPHEEPRYVRWIMERNRRWLEGLSRNPEEYVVDEAAIMATRC